jgi:hypothetical protein
MALLLVSSGVAPTQAASLPAPAAASEASAGACMTASNDSPWGVAALRIWTPNNAQPGAGTVGNPGIAEGAPFEARLVRAHGRDTANSKEMVLLERADGCRSAFPSTSFIEADRAVVRAALLANPPAPDPASYDLFVDPAFVTPSQLDSGVVEVHETQHFAIWNGTDTTAFSYRWQQDRGVRWQAGVETLATWMEESYISARDITGAPMPYAGTAEKKKINIYVCGTGLPWFDDKGDCGASAGSNSMFVSAVYIADGSSTMVHEFGHVLQFFTGGFTGELDGVGKIFETHANWLSASLNPFFNIWYYQNLERGPEWWTNYYGAFPLLLQLSEQDNTRDLIWRAWQENRRGPDGQSEEDLLETVVRLGEQDGVYPNGFASFADDLGRYGGRLAANDFLQGKVFADTTSYRQEASRYVGLTPTDGIGAFIAPQDRPLWQFGSHVVPITPVPSATEIRVTLTGAAQTDAAGWRYVLTGVKPGSAPIYSTLGRAGNVDAGATIALPVEAGREYFLAVTATPTSHESLGGQDIPTTPPTTYPYSVTLVGAQPQLPGTGTCLGPFTGPDAVNLSFGTNGQLPYDQPCASIGATVTIDRGPADVTAAPGSAATFSADVSSPSGHTLQWQFAAPLSTRWQNITGATTTSVTLPGTSLSGTRVRVVARDNKGTAYASFPAGLTVTAPAVSFVASVQVRCIAERAVLTTTVTNSDTRPLVVTISSKYGAKSPSTVQPSRTSSATFTTRSTSTPGGEVTITAVAPGEPAVQRSVPYSSRTCS